MVKEYYYEFADVGDVLVRHNSRARRISIKVKDGEVILVIPPFVDDGVALEFLHKNKLFVTESLKKSKSKIVFFDEKTNYKTLTFSLNINRTDKELGRAYLKKDVLTIEIPQKMPISSDKTQKMIQKILLAAMKIEAKKVLPTRVSDLAARFGFKFKAVNIRLSRTRWGSCSSQGMVSLSVYLMRLPSELIDYVILHELCHTKEMNHGPRFWSLLDSVCGGKNAKFRAMLKKYTTTL